MQYRLLSSLALLTGTAATAAGQDQEKPRHHHTANAVSMASGTTPLHKDLGSYSQKITTGSATAQQYFDQGLRLTYAFNHEEAINSFRAAIGHDSTCAMCWWGLANALGPNINAPMDTSAVRPAYEAIQRARQLSAKATPRERALIEATAKRYAAEPTPNRAPLDSAYAKAMRHVARTYPNDPDAQTLYAEALMDLTPWNYWTDRGRTPRPGTQEVVTTLERTIKANPNHPGACHFYIHIVEASTNPDRAVPCADRLAKLMPGAGHLVHMPTHIYMRTGRYDLVAKHNHDAVHADEEFIQDRRPTGFYQYSYYPHNYHMMWAGLMMLGRGDETLEAARKIVSVVPADVVLKAQPLEYFLPTPYLSLARFERWDEVLAEPAPRADLKYTTGMWHYTRGLAHAAKGHAAQAKAELDKATAMAAAIPEDQVAGINSAKALLAVAQGHLNAKIAAVEGDTARAITLLQEAITREDALTYDEPPAWYHPLRLELGKLYLAAGRPAEAERTFREDLEYWRETGWALKGLAKSLRAQGKNTDAAAVEQRFKKAWGATAARASAVRLGTGLRMRYVEQGDPKGLPVILLHGYSDSWFSFSRVLPLLPDRYRVYALDLRGHGESDRPASGYTMRDLAGDVIAFMDAKGIRRATVVGHSMGSFVAQQVALAAPARVPRLILIASGTTVRHVPGLAELRRTIDSLPNPVPVEFAREFQASTVYRPLPAEFMDQVVQESLKLPAPAWRALLNGMLAMQPAAGLAASNIPTLIVWGDRDGMFLKGEQDALVAMLPSAALKVYPETGHSPHWERPVEFARDFEEFIDARRVAASDSPH